MILVSYALKNRTVMVVFILLISIGGLLSYDKIGRLEDPEFTIKEAVIYTQYPGATAEEVELEITEPLEIAVQQLKQLHEVRSMGWFIHHLRRGSGLLRQGYPAPGLG